jgi:uncharacterized membrane-anchored protein
MMNIFSRYKYAFAGLLALSQIAVLYTMVESRANILRTGREMTLLTEPVDPRDLLRGDFVILGYAISQIANGAILGPKPTASGSTNVYIALNKGAGADWVLSRASWQPITDLKAEEIVMVGKTTTYFSPDIDPVSLTYGIERYYVPEGQGKDIEQGQAQKLVQVTLAVAENGQAQIKSLALDGKTLYSEPLY